MKTLVLVLLAICSYAGSTKLEHTSADAVMTRTAAGLDVDDQEEDRSLTKDGRGGVTVDYFECDDSDYIACANDTGCLPTNWICDGANDCADESDEDDQLCTEWKNDDCNLHYVMCNRNGLSNCMTISNYCTTTNPFCEGDLDRRICKMLENTILEDLDNIIVPDIHAIDFNRSLELAYKFQELIPYTLSHNNCPSMYTLVGDQCLSIFHIGSMSWGESREFCKMLKGDLFTFKNINHYAAVAQHLQRYEITSNFWIGGQRGNTTEEWIWIDDTPMELGSPYWEIRYSSECVERDVTVAESDKMCFHYYQAPEAKLRGHCVSLNFEKFFYMTDENCLKKMSPLCVYKDQ